MSLCRLLPFSCAVGSQLRKGGTGGSFLEYLDVMDTFDLDVEVFNTVSMAQLEILIGTP